MSKRKAVDGWVEGIFGLLGEAFEQAALRGDRSCLVTVWTAREAPSAEERERLHDHMIARYGAGFVGSLGSDSATSRD